MYDGDALDNLAHDASRLHIGRRNEDQTADDLLQDRTSAPQKAAILSALASFDPDDDERDDTYDVEDVGGTVDSVLPNNKQEDEDADHGDDEHTETLFWAWKRDRSIFERDAVTRRSEARDELRIKTGLADELIEGWAIMLARDAKRIRRLESKFTSFTGQQTELSSTAWRSGELGKDSSDTERRSFRGRAANRHGRGGRKPDANQAGEDGTGTEGATTATRRRNEANKGSRANHNRRNQRAKKMARGGFSA